jgi:hypothetical protein
VAWEDGLCETGLYKNNAGEVIRQYRIRVVGMQESTNCAYTNLLVEHVHLPHRLRHDHQGRALAYACEAVRDVDLQRLRLENLAAVLVEGPNSGPNEVDNRLPLSRHLGHYSQGTIPRRPPLLGDHRS